MKFKVTLVNPADELDTETIVVEAPSEQEIEINIPFEYAEMNIVSAIPEQPELPVKFQEQAAAVGMELSKAERYAQNYIPFLTEITNVTTELKKLDKNKKGDAAKANRIKIDLGKLCSKLEEVKKADKAEHLVITRYLDGLFNTVNGAARLTQGEAKEVAEHLANLQAEEKKKLRETRLALLQSYDENAHTYSVEELSPEAFEDLLGKLKAGKEYRDRVERMKASTPLVTAPAPVAPMFDEAGNMTVPKETIAAPIANNPVRSNEAFVSSPQANIPPLPAMRTEAEIRAALAQFQKVFEGTKVLLSSPAAPQGDKDRASDLQKSTMIKITTLEWVLNIQS